MIDRNKTRTRGYTQRYQEGQYVDMVGDYKGVIEPVLLLGLVNTGTIK